MWQADKSKLTVRGPKCHWAVVEKPRCHGASWLLGDLPGLTDAKPSAKSPFKGSYLCMVAIYHREISLSCQGTTTCQVLYFHMLSNHSWSGRGARTLRRELAWDSHPSLGGTCPLFFWVPSWTYIQGSMLLSKPEQLRLKEAHTISKLGCQVRLRIPWFLAASDWARPGPKPQSTSIKRSFNY